MSHSTRKCNPQKSLPCGRSCIRKSYKCRIIASSLVSRELSSARESVVAKKLEKEILSGKLNPTLGFGKEIRHAYLRELGVDQVSIDEMDKLLYEYGLGYEIQKSAMAKISKEMTLDTALGNALRKQIALESMSADLLSKRIEISNEKYEADKSNAASELRSVWEDKREYWLNQLNSRRDAVYRGDPYTAITNLYMSKIEAEIASYGGMDLTRQSVDNFDDFMTEYDQYAGSNPSSSEIVLYRAGPTATRNIESWSTNPESTAFTGERGAVSFLRDGAEPAKMTLTELRSKGYQPLGGFTNMMGAPGESEVTMIRVK